MKSIKIKDMKSRFLRKGHGVAWVIAVLLALVFRVGAFPPAPDHVIFGLVRDKLGNPVTSSSARVILTTTAGAQVTTKIVPSVEPGVNYRMVVHMDAGSTTDSSSDTVLRPNVPFRIQVVIGNTTNLPIQMQGDYASLGMPAMETRLDLTLGVDSSGDGLPDAWKQLILSMSGGLYNSIKDIRADGHFPGNPMTFLQCYIAGTYAWDTNSLFVIDYFGNENGTNSMGFQSVRGRSYTVMGSADLKTWTPVSFRLGSDGDSGVLRSNFSSTISQAVRIKVPPQAGMGNNLFFKANVQ